MIASTTRSRLQHCLDAVDFPASKQDLLNAAYSNGGDDETKRALRAIPCETYTNLDQVLASVSIVAEDDEILDAGKAAARRRGRVAPKRPRTSRMSPVVQELGENRGS